MRETCAAAPLRVRPAEVGDVEALAPRLRAADAAEVAALGLTAHEALAHSVAASVEPFAVIDAAGVVCALFGLGLGLAPGPRGRPRIGAPLRVGAPLRIGAPWLLGAPELVAARRAFLVGAPVWLERIARPADLLVNRADVRNRLHLAWLARSGFALLAARPHGPERRLFVEFARLARP